MSEQGEAAAEVTNGVLLVRGGGVLEGTITCIGDRYQVTRDGVEMSIAADRVNFVCRSLAEAYEWQCSQLPRDTAEAHLDLADWCLRYGLTAQAERELTAVGQLEPRHPRLRLLERHLTTAKTQSTARPENADEQLDARQRAADEMRELEREIADLPPGVLERFTRRIQPMLVNNCTTTGCHQPGGQQEFQLDRAVVHGLSNRRTTLRNLTATLRLIDRRQPHESSVITIPRESHGGMERPIFGPRQEDQLRQLIDWVGQVTDPTVASSPVADVPQPTAARISTQAAPAARAVRPASFETFEAEVPTLRPKQPLRYGAQITPWQPRDPFDPEIFNRQTRAAASPAASTAEGDSDPSVSVDEAIRNRSPLPLPSSPDR